MHACPGRNQELVPSTQEAWNRGRQQAFLPHSQGGLADRGTKWLGLGLGKGWRPRLTHSPPQEWDYTYVHSFYHCALAMSFVLLLPKVNKKAGNAGAPAKLTFSTLCCTCV